MSKIKIFPIPYAGASVNVYYGWKKLLPNGYELCMIELAGRGCRFKEPFYQSVDEAINDITREIIARLKSDDEYVIFGHSMGALLVYEAYYMLQKMGVKAPKHLFVSGHNAPHYSEKMENIENLDNVSFMKIVEQFGGISEEFYNKEIMDIFLPILRADFIMLDRYTYQPKVDKINCGVSVFYSEGDFSTNFEKIEKWSELVERNVNFYKFSGDHFFLNKNPNDVVNCIVKEIRV